MLNLVESFADGSQEFYPLGDDVQTGIIRQALVESKTSCLSFILKN